MARSLFPPPMYVFFLQQTIPIHNPNPLPSAYIVQHNPAKLSKRIPPLHRQDISFRYGFLSYRRLPVSIFPGINSPQTPTSFFPPPLSGRVGSTSGRSYLNRPRTASPVRVHCSCAASTNLPSSLLGRRADPNAGPHIPPNPKLPSLSHLLSFSSRTCA
jgi:hypothetical protein